MGARLTSEQCNEPQEEYDSYSIQTDIKKASPEHFEQLRKYGLYLYTKSRRDCCNHHIVILKDSERILDDWEFHIYINARNCISGIGKPIKFEVRTLRDTPNEDNLHFKFEIDMDLTLVCKVCCRCLEKTWTKLQCIEC